MKQAKNTGKKATIIKVDKNLDKYLEKGLFKEKIDKANHVLKTIGLPKFEKLNSVAFILIDYAPDVKV